MGRKATWSPNHAYAWWVLHDNKSTATPAEDQFRANGMKWEANCFEVQEAEIVGVYKFEGAVWVALLAPDGRSKELPLTAVLVLPPK